MWTSQSLNNLKQLWAHSKAKKPSVISAEDHVAVVAVEKVNKTEHSDQKGWGVLEHVLKSSKRLETSIKDGLTKSRSE